MNITLNIIKEGFMIGLVTLIIGFIIKFIIDYLFKPKDDNKYYIFIIILFITGFIAHIICQYTGINKWYCKNGVACIE